MFLFLFLVFFFQAEDGIRDRLVTGVQTCALPIYCTLFQFCILISQRIRFYQITMKISNKLNFKITSYLALGSLCLLEACTSTPADDAETAAEVETIKTRTVEVINPSRRSFNAELHIVGTAMANQQVMVHEIGRASCRERV